MRKEAMKREREAIDSEFQLALTSDENRKRQIINTSLVKDCPLQSFGWGNKKSLKPKKVLVTKSMSC